MKKSSKTDFRSQQQNLQTYYKHFTKHQFFTTVSHKPKNDYSYFNRATYVHYKNKEIGNCACIMPNNEIIFKQARMYMNSNL